ncbi:lipocalin family protein [Mangrovibacterium marinum]|uniref:Apolipoprotein D and lipocalin family protein n=1 Tax=Mangrovibacterium marinum TaxID=1639118 RepID=A0A2T5C4R1_9BACT|nr:lipocalin family protein [Mangrovibacterium marinum]PTN09858.1 apolipoprotein D and lipocalin family protein [Mangrovibacterium marinum]
MLKNCLLFTAVLALLSACSSTGNIDTRTVQNVDIDRYLGTWYEIARYPNSFEKGLVGVTANYQLREDGKIQVVNSGRKSSLNGEYKTATGRAKIPNPQETGKLKVSFFWIFYADYYILELDTMNYNYALIGSSSPDYLWILSRSPQMNPQSYQMLIDSARKRGYDVNKLEKVLQPGL